MSERERGVIDWFSAQKGYGFIKRQRASDVFFHYSSIQMEGYKTLKEGDKVEFTVTKGEKGPQAEDVRLIEKSEEK